MFKPRKWQGSNLGFSNFESPTPSQPQFPHLSPEESSQPQHPGFSSSISCSLGSMPTPREAAVPGRGTQWLCPRHDLPGVFSQHLLVWKDELGSDTSSPRSQTGARGKALGLEDPRRSTEGSLEERCWAGEEAAGAGGTAGLSASRGARLSPVHWGVSHTW